MNTNQRSQFPAHVALLIVAIIYGFNYFLLKAIFNDPANIHPLGILAFRAIFGGGFFAIFYFLFIREKIQNTKDYIRLFFCGLFGISINQLFFIWGISKTQEVNASVLMITAPIFVFLIALFFRQENITLKKIGGLFLAFLGAFLLISESANGNFSFSNDTFTGDMMIVINAASYGTYLILVRPLILRYNTFTIVAWIFIFGSLINIPIGIQELLKIPFQELGGQAQFGLAYLVILTTIVAYFFNAWALKKLPASAASMYIFVQPIFVALVSAFYYLDKLTLSKFFFIVLIMFGVFLVTNLNSKKSLEANV